jgi:hypothetical protein
LIKSSTTSDFWKAYATLPADAKARARKAYRLWRRNAAHPSLRFKKVGHLWSLRIDLDYRALALQVGDTLFWFWIGVHDEYERLING